MPNVSFAPRRPRRARLLGGTGAALALLLAGPLRAEPAPEAGADSRINLRIEPKAEGAPEPKRELRADPKPDKPEAKPEQKVERPTAGTVAVPTEAPQPKKASRELDGFTPVRMTCRLGSGRNSPRQKTGLGMLPAARSRGTLTVALP